MPLLVHDGQFPADTGAENFSRPEAEFARLKNLMSLFIEESTS
jgi:hypothetical protein